jgi:hypothetical protein
MKCKCIEIRGILNGMIKWTLRDQRIGVRFNWVCYQFHCPLTGLFCGVGWGGGGLYLTIHNRIWSRMFLFANSFKSVVAHSNWVPWLRGHIPRGTKWQKREPNHSSPSSVEVKNAWNFTSSYACIFQAQEQLPFVPKLAKSVTNTSKDLVEISDLRFSRKCEDVDYSLAVTLCGLFEATPALKMYAIRSIETPFIHL